VGFSELVALRGVADEIETGTIRSKLDERDDDDDDAYVLHYFDCGLDDPQEIGRINE
jgi:hypothetical protein